MDLLNSHPPATWRSLRYVHTITLRYLRRQRIVVSDEEWVTWATMLNKPALPSTARTGMQPLRLAGFAQLPPRARVVLAKAFVEQRPIGVQQSSRVLKQLHWILQHAPADAIQSWETSHCLDLRAAALIATHQPHALMRLWKEELLSQPFNAVLTQGALALELGLHDVAEYFLSSSFPQQWEDQRYRIVQDFGILAVWVALLTNLPHKMPQWASTYMECEMQDSHLDAHQHAWNTNAFNENERLQLLADTSGPNCAEPLPWKWTTSLSIRTEWLANKIMNIMTIDRLRAVFDVVLPEHRSCLELIAGTLEEQQAAMVQFCAQSATPSGLAYPEILA